MCRPGTGTSRERGTFDGYKTHLNVDPDNELITNVAVTAANTPDREVIDELLSDPAPTSLPPTPTIAPPTPNPLPTDLALTPTRVPARMVARNRKTLRFTGIRPTPTGPPCTSRPSGAMTCAPRCRRYATPTASPRTSSASTCPPAPSPARPITLWPSAMAVAIVRPASGHYVDPARYGRPARKPVAGG